jgi:Cu+-exporting ATPase
MIIEQPLKKELLCYHCGTPCIVSSITIDDKAFCCDGCKLVYEILNENSLCDYYKLQSHPGLSQIKPIRNDKFSYLDNEDIASKLYKFNDGKNAIVTLYIPGIHCSSCMWLMEHMYRLDAGIKESRLNFSTKEVTIRFRKDEISMRKVVELLTTIGYEPSISLDDVEGKSRKTYNRKLVYKLGIAGFCFGNIMMLSFPEYLSDGVSMEDKYAQLFRALSLVLSLPVFFYSGSEFFISAWKGLKQKMLNIDAPIALALVITFSRSLYEILSGTGSGFLDSMSGIVFFMLVGRVVQERTYRSISFHRDYKAYFPIAVDVVTRSGVESKSIQDLREKDLVQLHNDEIVPADGVVVKGNANIDYSFVTGESESVAVAAGGLIYAGGRQVGEQLTIQVTKPVATSYLTSLWDHFSFSKNKSKENDKASVTHVLSRYFTYVLFGLAGITAIFWAINDPSKILPSVSAMLIVACPCALLLSTTYTNGNLLRIFSNNGLFLRDATVIEQLGNIDHIVFDKTGTLTQAGGHIDQIGHELSEPEKDQLAATIAPSKHPYSRALASYLGQRSAVSLSGWKEVAGQGIEAYICTDRIMVGSARFVGVPDAGKEKEQGAVYVRINNKITAFKIVSDVRKSVPAMLQKLRRSFSMSLLSGDNDRQREAIGDFFGLSSAMLFEQKPIDKLQYIDKLQAKGEKVLMLGDGLNDAGALQQSNVGITLADDINNFTPSCDAILDATRFSFFPNMMKLARSARYIIVTSFVISILYNIVGLYISVQGKMSPMIAAILMPVSTISIVLITTGLGSLVAMRYGLSVKSNTEDVYD